MESNRSCRYRDLCVRCPSQLRCWLIICLISFASHQIRVISFGDFNIKLHFLVFPFLSSYSFLFNSLIFHCDVSPAADLSWKQNYGLETGDALGLDPHSVIHQCFGLLSTPDGYSAPVYHFFCIEGDRE